MSQKKDSKRIKYILDFCNKYEKVFMAGGVFVAFLGILATYGVIQNQISEMRDEQRPWVYAELTPLEEFDLKNFDKDDLAEFQRLNLIPNAYITYNSGNSGVVKINFNLLFQNTGKLPAFKVAPHPRPISPPITISTCDEVQQDPNTKDGVTLFPKQKYIKSVNSPILIDSLKSSPNEPFLLTANIGGCITYNIPGNSKTHKTGFALQVALLKKDSTILLNKTNILPAVIRIDFTSPIEQQAD